MNSPAEEHLQGSSEAVLHLHLTASSCLVQHLPAQEPGSQSWWEQSFGGSERRPAEPPSPVAAGHGHVTAARLPRAIIAEALLGPELSPPAASLQSGVSVGEKQS